MSILKTESIASRPISDVYSPRVFSVPRGLKSTRTIACTPCTGSISPLRSILSSSSSSKRERERERKKESVSILAERAHNKSNSFWIIHTKREREREREKEERTQHASTAGFRHLRARFFPRFRRFLPVSASHVKLLSSSSKRIVVDPPSRRAFSTSMRSPFCKVSSSPPFGI